MRAKKRHHGRRGLRRRIYAHLIIALVVAIVTSGLVSSLGFRRELVRASAHRLARHVAAQLAAEYQDPSRRHQTLIRISDALDKDLTLRALDGRLIDAAGAPFPPLTAEETGRVRRGEAITEHHGRFFTAAPVIVDGAIVAVLEASPMFRSWPQPTMVRPLLMVALVLVIAGVASGPLARRISLPVERLTAAVRRFGGGDLGARVEIRERKRPRRRAHHDELEELTRAFNEMAERIERSVRGQKELLANVSHELRSPLARIRVALELLPRDGKNDVRFADLEADLVELDRLIEDTLTAARLDGAALPMQKKTVDVAALLGELATRAAHDPATAAKEVRVSAGEELFAVADGALLKRALWNLVENAAKYGAPPIDVSAEKQGGAVVFRVSDAGAGVAPEERERIFEPFYRGDKARTPGNGFGLGLTLARRVAEAHGGRITVDGATFTLSIPAE